MFHSARLKLTAWYLMIIMIISISFSVVIYKELTNEVDRFARIQRARIERRLLTNQLSYLPQIQTPNPTQALIDPDLILETEHRLFIALVIVNGAIFLFSGGLGYILAGETLKPIAEMVEEQNRFITDSSHELRTPLTSLKSALEVSLRNPRLALPEAKTVLRESINEVDKLQSLSDQLLKLAQFEKPLPHVSMRPVSISVMVENAIRKVKPIADAKHTSLKYSLSDALVLGDIQHLTDVFIILLDNAIKYSPDGGSISITSRKQKNTIVISIKDHGMGIAASDLPHIFDRFYRADAARSKNNTNGYGLGLSIAKKIIDEHKGAIEVRSILNKGTTVTVNLPLRLS